MHRAFAAVFRAITIGNHVQRRLWRRKQATAILRLPTVKARTGLSRSTIYLRISEGRFPKPVSLGGRAVGWIEAEVNDWLNQQIETSRKAAH
jgi:prophage regulatory protein